MEYVCQQQPRKTNAVGVPISIDVLDSNSNYRHIGDTISDQNGFFSLQWTPDIAGEYTVYASFAGSESYYPKQALTAFAVADQYFVPAIVGLFVFMAVIAIVIVLAIRKKP